jgi:hypothetical protein
LAASPGAAQIPDHGDQPFDRDHNGQPGNAAARLMMFGSDTAATAGSPEQPAAFASHGHRGGELMRALARFRAALARSLRAHSIFIAIVLGHFAVTLLLPWFFKLPTVFSAGLYGSVFAVLTTAVLAVLFGIYAARVMIVVRPEHLARYLLQDLRARYLNAERLCTALPVFLLIPLIMATFSYVKSTIPVINPGGYDWDPLLAEWDKALHGGHHPWEWLQPVLGYPYITFGINLAYNIWFLVLYGVMFWQTFSIARPRLRMQYALTLVIVWILLGNVLAILFASGGPVYYGRLTGLADPFAPLMDYLHATDAVLPLWAVETQEYLWQTYIGNEFALGCGISAMPSIHLATAFSFVLLGFATNRRLGYLFGVFALFILIGSVHLGWHYAIDGYAGVIGTWLIWRAVGWLLDRPAVAALLWPETASEVGRVARQGGLIRRST